jgi:hypothetical protein
MHGVSVHQRVRPLPAAGNATAGRLHRCVAATVLCGVALGACGGTPEITSDDAARVIELNLHDHGAAAAQSIGCVRAENTKRTFTCSVVTADGQRNTAVVRCEKPRGEKNGRPDAECVVGPPGS